MRKKAQLYLAAVIFLTGLGACNAGGALSAAAPSSTVVAPTTAANANQASNGNAAAVTPVVTTPGAPCGYNQKGQMLHIAEGIDVCLPPVVCTSEVCPPQLGDCVNGNCVYKTGYQGLATLPEVWTTYYCELSSGGCNGVSQSEPPLTTATKVSTLLGLPLCEGSSASTECVGIAASPAMLIGNSQVAMDPATKTYVKPWGLGLTEASGVCYRLTGPGGSVVVALTDRCGGYCKCNGSGFQECGPCVSAADMVTNCPCVGTAPPAYGQCCGSTCNTTVVPACDWCANNNHAHFDLDAATFNYVCGAKAVQGSCQITQLAPIACPMNVAWPPS